MIEETEPVTSNGPSRPKPLRLWPGIIIVVLTFLVRFGLPMVAPDTAPLAAMSGLLGWLLLAIWWLFLSRAPKFERWSAVPLMLVALFATYYLLDKSIATAGMGMLYPIYAIPGLLLAFVVCAAATRNLPAGTRRWTMVATIVVACGAWALVRTGGFTMELDQDFAFRWAATPEEELLAGSNDKLPTMALDSALLSQTAAWPGFRGPRHDGVVPA